MKIDISADMGESYGRYTLGHDDEIMPLISSANVACGWHAGDPMIMRATVRLAKAHGVAVGCHVGLPDTMGFGRRKMDLSLDEFKNYFLYQTGALMGIAAAEGLKLQHATFHAAMGNLYLGNREYSKAFVDAVAEIDGSLIIPIQFGPKGQILVEEAERQGVRTVKKFFADRAYTKEMTLVDRKRPGAVLHDPSQVLERTERMIKEGLVTAIDGQDIEMRAQSIMMHGDTPSAVDLARVLRRHLEREGISVVPMKELFEVEA